MARFEPTKELIGLKNKLSKKNSVEEFKSLYREFRKELVKIPDQERWKGGEYETIFSELSTLLLVIEQYKPLYIEYNGGSGSSKDGTLYFNERNQNVEIIGMINENENKSFRKTQGFSQSKLSIIAAMDEHGCSEDMARKILKSQAPEGTILVEDFLREQIVSVLSKKNKDKYKDFWLLISYIPRFGHGGFGDKRVRDFVLNKIKSREKDLIVEIKSIFKKIIFVPFDEGKENHQIFEWPL